MRSDVADEETLMFMGVWSGLVGGVIRGVAAGAVDVVLSVVEGDAQSLAGDTRRVAARQLVESAAAVRDVAVSMREEAGAFVDQTRVEGAVFVGETGSELLEVAGAALATAGVVAGAGRARVSEVTRYGVGRVRRVSGRRDGAA